MPNTNLDSSHSTIVCETIAVTMAAVKKCRDPSFELGLLGSAVETECMLEATQQWRLDRGKPTLAKSPAKVEIQSPPQMAGQCCKSLYGIAQGHLSSIPKLHGCVSELSEAGRDGILMCALQGLR
ncbi:hypothetical protein PpBr36_00044 [Pyricularia pennisetigena]|uniref:hypothetical protein n=1 Tax=Pyricularia pennisetigena TaxID=1578925 RepID=UPI0011512200|nr:hypothetical protein PpBr36_00044 [Pyricularia pennisetigena]TLS29190.1 hypothetical protein PpBr36_00044 [Pyricularia pennisetigena]